jgi:hypothetical protein
VLSASAQIGTAIAVRRNDFDEMADAVARDLARRAERVARPSTAGCTALDIVR